MSVYGLNHNIITFVISSLLWNQLTEPTYFVYYVKIKFEIRDKYTHLVDST